MGHLLFSTKQGTFSRWGAAKQQISVITTEMVKTGKPSFFSLLERFCGFCGKNGTAAHHNCRLDRF
jgi:hypothetical protein